MATKKAPAFKMTRAQAAAHNKEETAEMKTMAKQAAKKSPAKKSPAKKAGAKKGTAKKTSLTRKGY